MASNCTCELRGSGGLPANDSACAEMLRSCGGGGGGSVSVSVGVALLFLLAACALGGFWCWKHRDAGRLALPTCLRRSGRGRRDYSKTLSLRPHAVGSTPKAPAGAQGRRPAAREAAPCDDDYENLEVGPPKAEEVDAGLYENARPAGSAEPKRGNEASSPYYNFQMPVSPETPQDEEDIYILPD